MNPSGCVHPYCDNLSKLSGTLCTYHHNLFTCIEMQYDRRCRDTLNEYSRKIADTHEKFTNDMNKFWLKDNR